MGWRGEGRGWNGIEMRVATRWVTTVGWMDRRLNASDLVLFVYSTQPFLCMHRSPSRIDTYDSNDNRVFYSKPVRSVLHRNGEIKLRTNSKRILC